MAAEVLRCSCAGVVTRKLTRSRRDVQALRSPLDTVSLARRKSVFQGLQVFSCLPASAVQNGQASALRVDSTTMSELPKSCSLSKVIVVDNYDSFTYNLCQYLGDLGCNYEVFRNDKITLEELKAKKPRGILISPGPGAPKDSGISLDVVLQLGSEIPIFGVCMGLQCMGEAYGGKIVRSPFGVVHGKTSPVYYDEKGEDGLLAGLPNPFIACRYHSLVIDKESFPSEELEITAWTEDGLIMGVRHHKYRHVQGVQFHPESIITQDGKKIVANFLKILDAKDAANEAKAEKEVCYNS